MKMAKCWSNKEHFFVVGIVAFQIPSWAIDD